MLSCLPAALRTSCVVFACVVCMCCRFVCVIVMMIYGVCSYITLVVCAVFTMLYYVFVLVVYVLCVAIVCYVRVMLYDIKGCYVLLFGQPASRTRECASTASLQGFNPKKKWQRVGGLRPLCENLFKRSIWKRVQH